VIVVIDPDGAAAARSALDTAARSGDRVAVWVGEEDDPALAEMRAELSARRPSP
jgi:hypothetical protein